MSKIAPSHHCLLLDPYVVLIISLLLKVLLVISLQDIQSPMLFRSEAEQLCGHELLKALSNFKQSTVASLSPSIQQNKLLEKEGVGMHPEDNQSHSRQQNIKIKSRKSEFKVLRDMSTKNGSL
jgi:hypothetical protein